MPSRVTDPVKDSVTSCVGSDLDDEALSLWKALLDQRPDIMQVAAAELLKNPVITAEAFLEAVSQDKD